MTSEWGGWEGARARLLGLYPDQSCSPASGLLLLGLGLLGSCQGLTGTWLGVGQGQAVGGEPFWQWWGRAVAGWGTLAGSVSSGWLLGPSQDLCLFSGRHGRSVLTCPRLYILARLCLLGCWLLFCLQE